MQRALIVILVVAAGCKDKAPAGGPGSANGSGSGSGSGATTVAPAGCELAGDYRLRFRSNGRDNWWFRFRVSGAGPSARAEILEPIDVIMLEPGPIKAALDPAACKISLATVTEPGGDIKLALAIDPKTTAVTGQLTRTKATSDDEKAVVIAGQHDVGAPKSPACLVAGMYKLTFDPKAKWKNPAAGDKRSCRDESAGPLYLRIEPWGDAVAITEAKEIAPHTDTFADTTITGFAEHGAQCDLELALKTEGIDFAAKLTLLADAITGTAEHARVQVVEDGEAGENIWDCAAKAIALTAARMP